MRFDEDEETDFVTQPLLGNQENKIGPVFKLPDNHYNVNLPDLQKMDYRQSDKEHQVEQAPVLNFGKEVIEMKIKEDPELVQLREQIINKMQKNHFFWECTPPTNPVNYDESYYYRFDLPKSKFDDEDNVQKIEMPVYTFQSQRQKLNPQQVKEIWKSRTFKVKSEMEDLPHTWKLSPWLIHSSEEKTSFIKHCVAASWQFLFAIPNILNPCSDRVIEQGKCKAMSKPNLFSVIVSIFAFILNLLDMIIGIRFCFFDNNFENTIHKNIAKKYFLELSNRESGLGNVCRLIEWLKPPNVKDYDMDNVLEANKYQKKLKRVQDLINQLNQADSTFIQLHNEELKKALNAEDYEEEELKAIRMRFDSEKQEKLYKFLEKFRTEFVEPEIVGLLLKKLHSRSLYDNLMDELDIEIIAMKKKVKEDFSKNRPIYSLIAYKRENAIKKNIAKQEKIIRSKFEYQLEDLLDEEEFSEEALLASEYHSFAKKMKAIEKKETKLYKKHASKSMKIKHLSYRRLPHNYVKTNTSKDINNPYWSLQKFTFVNVRSRYLGWRIVKFILGYLFDIYNVNYWLIRNIWSGRYGIKCMFLCSDFYVDEIIDHRTGEYIRNKSQRIFPIYRTFTAVMKGISICRKRFEDSRDDGFFGKGVSRIFNILDCYLIRFFFVGIIGIIFIHPVLNILNILVSILLILTSFIWIAAFEVISLVWKLLIFDFSSTMPSYHMVRYQYNKRFLESRLLRLVKSPRCLPLISLLWDFLFQVPIQLIACVIVLVSTPVLCVLVFVFGSLAYIIKNIWDWLLLNLLIRHCARVPSSNTCYAIRISGPGISRDFYNSIESRHLSLLVIAHLEKLELEQLKIEVNQIFNYPSTYIKSKYTDLLQDITYNHTSNKYINRSFQNLSFLYNSLNYFVDKKKQKLPSIIGGNHTIRFTKEDLERNQMIIEGVLTEIIEEKGMDRYIWTRYNLRPGLNNRLVRGVLQDVLTADALLAVEQIDNYKRVNYSKSKFSNYVKDIVNEENENYQQKRRQRNIRLVNLQQNLPTRAMHFTNLITVLNFYSTGSDRIQHPFKYYPTRPQDIDDYEKFKEK